MIIQSCHFCGSSDSLTIKATSRDKLLAEYKQMYGLSFPPSILESNFVFDIVITYKCKKCGTRSYHPNIIGNSLFYDYLSNNLQWYYSKNRWEFQIAAEILDKEKPQLFLEVGCGDGHFLNLARNRGHEGHGSEINPRSIETLKSQGFQVLTDLERDIQEREYDALVMFQLLEHLLDPFSFLKSIIAHVRSQGIIIVSTPVTPSCCASIASPCLVLPPHHQWMPTTLGHRMLADRLGLMCEGIIYDPPDPYQVVYGLRKRLSWLPNLLDRYNGVAGRVARLMLKIAKTLRYDWANVGHTVLVISRKV
jgi:SAM-dependent methyltransferase